MARFIAMLLSLLIIQPALPYESNAEAFVQRMIYHAIMAQEYQSTYSEDYNEPKGRMHCQYENEYCNDVSEGDEPQSLSMNIESLDRSLEIVVCEGEEESYDCRSLNSVEVDFFHDY